MSQESGYRLTSPDPWVAAKKSQNPDELARLARHREAKVRRQVAQNPHTPLQALIQLRGDDDYSISEVALAGFRAGDWNELSQTAYPENPDNPAGTLHPLQKAFLDVLHGGGVSVSDLSELAAPEKQHPFRGVLGSPKVAGCVISYARENAPGDAELNSLVEALATHPYVLVRVMVARSREISEEVLYELSFDASVDVQQAILEDRPQIPSDIALQLGRSMHADVRSKVARKFHSLLLDRLEDEHLIIHASETTIPEFIRGLARHESDAVRFLLTRNPNVARDAEAMSVLARDPVEEIRVSAAERFPVLHVEHLHTDTSQGVRKALAGRRDVNPAIIATLANDDDPDVREAAALALLQALQSA